jgi:hypothetical protein
MIATERWKFRKEGGEKENRTLLNRQPRQETKRQDEKNNNEKHDLHRPSRLKSTQKTQFNGQTQEGKRGSPRFSGVESKPGDGPSILGYNLVV